MTDLTIGGETFRVEVEGETGRPSLMLSCSLGTDLTLWDAQMPALLEHFRVVRYDPRGHGRSGVGEAPFGIERLGRDALAILDALAFETTHFLGISMGGAVGQWLLVNAPERIERAVIANTSARLGTPDLWNGRIEAVLAGGMDALAAATMERWFGAAFRAALPERVEAIHAVFRATSPKGYAACCAALRDMDLRETLRAIDRPVLVITGRYDPVASPEDIALLTGSIAGATHVELDCKHISNIEAREAFDAAVIGFLTAPLAAARPARRRSPARTASTRARPANARRRPAAKVVAHTRAVPAKRPAAKAATKTTVPKKAASKTAVAKKAVAKKAAAKKAPAKKAAPTRRATAKARLPVRKPTTKTKATKAAAKKSVAKKPTKKVPAPRRNPTKKPRRASGRRKR